MKPSQKRQKDELKGERKEVWPTRVIVKYTFLQIPSAFILIMILLILRKFIYLPAWLIWVIVGVWIGKDIALFPFVWRSYDRPRPGDAFSMVGEMGIAEERIDPYGYARVHGELWKVELIGDSNPVEKGEMLRVRDVHGLILRVQPERQSKGDY